MTTRLVVGLQRDLIPEGDYLLVLMGRGKWPVSDAWKVRYRSCSSEPK
jgi:hypothetical protein